MSNNTNGINGLILAGGRSLRMGSDKGLLHYHGKPQREFLFELLGRHCAEVRTSCRKEQHVPRTLNPLYDRFDISGPLNGILSAMKYKESAWLVVAVDMPFVDDATLELLISHRDTTRLAVCFLNRETSLPEPLLTLWEPGASPFLSAFAESGKTSPREFLNTHPVKVIDPPDPRILINVNYPPNP